MQTTTGPEMKRSRTVLAAAVLTAVASLFMSGCSSPLIRPDSGPISDAGLTCAQFKTLSKAQQASITDVISSDSTVPYFSPTGASMVTLGKLFSLECAGAGSKNTKLESLAKSSGDPKCSDFVRVDPGIRDQWLQVEAAQWNDDTYWATSAESLTLDVVKRCAAGGPLSAAMTDAEASAKAADVASGASASFPHAITWTTTSKLGYKVTGSVSFGATVETGASPAFPGATNMTAGSGCGYDLSTDAVIPAQLVATNSASTAARASVGVSISNVTGTDLTTAYIDSGNFCSGPTGPGANAELDIQSSDTKLLAPGGSFTIDFFVILKNYLSPRYPAGAVSELADYVVSPTNWRSDSSTDPVVEGPGSVNLSLGSLAQ